jgi:hypothetical protein
LDKSLTFLNLDHQALANELTVLKPMMKQLKSKTINDALHELHSSTHDPEIGNFQQFWQMKKIKQFQKF